MPQGIFDRRMDLAARPADAPRNIRIGIRDVTDGTSNTYAVAECSPGFQAWGGWAAAHCEMNSEFPINYPWVIYGTPATRIAAGDHGSTVGHSASSYHEGGAFFLFCDGSVHFLSENMNFAVYQQLGLPQDGLPLGGLPQ
jgi:prepilin-type processing-associated H-X9-DG protein